MPCPVTKTPGITCGRNGACRLTSIHSKISWKIRKIARAWPRSSSAVWITLLDTRCPCGANTTPMAAAIGSPVRGFSGPSACFDSRRFADGLPPASRFDSVAAPCPKFLKLSSRIRWPYEARCLCAPLLRGGSAMRKGRPVTMARKGWWSRRWRWGRRVTSRDDEPWVPDLPPAQGGQSGNWAVRTALCAEAVTATCGYFCRRNVSWRIISDW